MAPFRNGAAGVVSSAKLFRPEDFAELTTLSAGFRWLRNFYLIPQPPLLCEEGNTAHSTFLQFIHTFYDRRNTAIFEIAGGHRPPLQARGNAFCALLAYANFVGALIIRTPVVR